MLMKKIPFYLTDMRKLILCFIFVSLRKSIFDTVIALP